MSRADLVVCLAEPHREPAGKIRVIGHYFLKARVTREEVDNIPGVRQSDPIRISAGIDTLIEIDNPSRAVALRGLRIIKPRDRETLSIQSSVDRVSSCQRALTRNGIGVPVGVGPGREQI